MSTEPMSDAEAEAEFRAMLERDYMYVRLLPDGVWIGLIDLLYTTALCVGLDQYGYERRYCYEEGRLALAELEKMQSGGDVPRGWIAARPPVLLKPKGK